ncbi:ABC transporter permease [Aestuariivirga sp.]|jgi:spermidine/putrescine transport system permease protein|uniref:ABC transporter permease n=1 Tax=Aestuariivirga sp. TaxID=2650926 RepID=UPI0037841B06
MNSKANDLERSAAREARFGLLLISPTAFYVLILMAGPLLAISAYSLLSVEPRGAGGALTLGNYGEVLTDPIFRTILLRTMVVSVIATLATVAVAYPVAYFVSFHVSASRKPLWLFLITIPFWTSYIIRVFLWKVILGYGGVISSALEIVGITTEPMSFIVNPIIAMIFTLAHAYAPFAILPIFVALEKIDRSFLEAGRDLGETAIGTFLRVTLPLSMPGVVAAALIVFIPTFGDYVTPDLIASGKFPMIANLVEVQMLKLNNKGLGSAIAIMVMLAIVSTSCLFLLMNRRILRNQ